MKLASTPSGLALAAALWGAFCPTAAAGTVSGRVMSGGKPVPGAMVTAFDEAKTRRDTVYSDAQGRYRLTIDFAGKVSLRARAPYFRDATKEVDMPIDCVSVVDYDLASETDPSALSNNLTASAHLTALSWSNPDTRAAFVSQCNYCHQIGNELTRISAQQGRLGRDRAADGGLSRHPDQQGGRRHRGDACQGLRRQTGRRHPEAPMERRTRQDEGQGMGRRR